MRNHPIFLSIVEIQVRLSCWLWSVAHNVVAHPLIPFFPPTISDAAHEWTYVRWDAARVRLRYSRVRGDDF